MPDTFLDKHTKLELTSRDVTEHPDSDALETNECFGFVRGSVREHVPMLELRKKTGMILALGYGYIERILFDPSEGITLNALGRTIRIKGRHLNASDSASGQLFRGIARHRVAWVQEVDQEARIHLVDRVPIVDAIEW